MDGDLQRLVERLGMAPLPVEGTWFVSTWRSDQELGGGEPVGTAMLGLYTADPPSRSLFHRLTHDEVWHHYAGDPLRLVLLHPGGRSEEVALGGDVLDGATVQARVPAGSWQAGELVAGGRWALFGCTMAPGFTGTCFEGGQAADLLVTHPDRAADIERLAVPAGHDIRMPDGFAD